MWKANRIWAKYHTSVTECAPILSFCPLLSSLLCYRRLLRSDPRGPVLKSTHCHHLSDALPLLKILDSGQSCYNVAVTLHKYSAEKFRPRQEIMGHTRTWVIPLRVQLKSRLLPSLSLIGLPESHLDRPPSGSGHTRMSPVGPSCQHSSQIVSLMLANTP